MALVGCLLGVAPAAAQTHVSLIAAADLSRSSGSPPIAWDVRVDPDPTSVDTGVLSPLPGHAAACAQHGSGSHVGPGRLRQLPG